MMSHAVETLERAEKVEEAGHRKAEGHSAHGSNKLVGLSMALIGVLVALCAAFVGGERNEMTRAMIDQTQATADATSASTKFRVIMIAVEQLRAATPPQQVKERFVALYKDYSEERQLTSVWANSFDPLVKAHFEATEEYEHAQLIAEIGIVFASLALLLGSRLPWYLAMVLAIVSIGQAGRTWIEVRHHVAHEEGKIESAHQAYLALRKRHTGDTSDADAIKDLDPTGAMMGLAEEKAKDVEAASAKGSDNPSEKKHDEK